jgi:ribonuclease P protein component
MNTPSKPVTKQTQSLADSRLRRHADYQRAYANSRKRQSASMSWFLAPRAQQESTDSKPTRPASDGPRVGLTVGKVMGKAHERNRIKRRMRETLRRHLELLPPHSDLILHPRRVVLSMEFTKLDAELVRILIQAKAEDARISAQVSTRPAAVSPA